MVRMLLRHLPIEVARLLSREADWDQSREFATVMSVVNALFGSHQLHISLFNYEVLLRVAPASIWAIQSPTAHGVGITPKVA